MLKKGMNLELQKQFVKELIKTVVYDVSNLLRTWISTKIFDIDVIVDEFDFIL
jgi:hypothetical protein